MWIFLPDAFFSIVEHRDNPDVLLVRARLQGDIEKHFPDADVVQLEAADYRYRAIVARAEVAEVVSRAVMEGINYPDFKSQVDEHDRHAAYFGVWSVMQDAQRREVPQKKRRAARG